MDYNYRNKNLRFHFSFHKTFYGIGINFSNKNPIADKDYFLIELQIIALRTYLMIYRT